MSDDSISRKTELDFYHGPIGGKKDADFWSGPSEAAVIAQKLSVLRKWRENYSPIVLLGLDETSGTTAYDSSGNGNDGLYAGSFALNQSGIYITDKKGVDFTDSTNSAIEYTSYPSVGPDHSFSFVTRIDFRPDGSSYYFDSNGTDRFIVASQGSADSYSFYDGTWKLSGYLLGLNDSHFASAKFDSTSSLGYLYLNGLPMFSDTYATSSVSGDTNIGSAFNTTGARQNGLYSLYFHSNQALSHEDFYQQWLDISGDQEHYYKETIIDELGLATLGASGSVLAHFPLWETAGNQAVDVSMNENHGDFVGGVTLGRDPIVDGFQYSVGIDDSETQYIEVTSLGTDLSSDSLTVAVAFQTDVTHSHNMGIYTHGFSTNYLGVSIDPAGDCIMQFYDGTNIDRLDITPDSDVRDTNPHRVVGRYNANNSQMDLWLDGKKLGSQLRSTTTMSPSTGAPTRFGGWGRNSTQGIEGRFNMLYHSHTALSSEDAASLSTDSLPTVLLDKWKDVYGPEVLLGLDETSGSTAEDSSGNGNDGIYAGSYTLAVDGPFVQDNKGVDLGLDTSGGTHVDLDGQISGGPNHSFIFAGDYDTSDSTLGILWDVDLGGDNRLAISLSRDSLETISIFDTTWRNTDYKFGRQSSKEAMIGIAGDSGTGLATYYYNGLPFGLSVYNAQNWDGTEPSKLGSRSDGADHPCGGIHSLAVITNSILSDADFYNQWLDISDNQKHYYKETIVDELGLAELGVTGSVVCHLPLWETAGNQAVDVSMYENHFDFVGGPSLSSDAPNDFALGSLDCTNTGQAEVSSSWDFSAGDWTITTYFKIPTSVTSGQQGIWNKTDAAGERVDCYWAAGGGDLRFVFYDGSNIARVEHNDTTLNDNEWHRVTCRVNRTTNEMAMWLDGVEVGTRQDPSGVLLSSTSAYPFVLTNGSFFSGGTMKIGLVTVQNSSVTDEECEAL